MIEALSVARLAQALGLAFVLGTGLLLLLSILPASRGTARQLWPLLGSEAVILAAGILPWLLTPLGTFACLMTAAGRIGFESGSVHGLAEGRKLSFVAAALLVAAAAAGWFCSTAALLWALSIVLVIAGTTLAGAGNAPVLGSAARFAIFPLVPLMAFSHVASHPRLAPLLILAFLLVEIFDSFSLLGGQLYGRTPLVPRLSPRKTWEGLATGAAALFATSAVLVLMLGLPFFPMLLGGAVVLFTAIAGDLLGSIAKRRAGVKDYPAVLSVQGGLLDIMDSWLVAGPCLAGLAVVIGGR